MNLKYIIILMLSLVISNLHSQDTILDDYIAEPDSNYTWYLHSSVDGADYTAYNLNLTSLQWRDESEVDYPVWQHWLSVFVPDEVSYETAFLLISGGSRHPDPPDLADDEYLIVGNLAGYTNSVMAILSTVPNEPLMFSDEDFTRTEDAIIAYSWDKFLTTGDSYWPVNLAMTKSAVKAMDTIEEFCADFVQGIPITNFVISGASKRGWTTWLTAIVDDRVKGIVPMVFDALNLITSFRQHWGSYGEWSFAVDDYVELEIFDWFDDPEINDLMNIVDPFSYKDRLTMPKYIIAATGDEFFVPAAQNYIHDLPGANMMGYYPNVGHGFADDAILYLVQNLTVFYQSVLNDTPLPQFSWERQTDGSLLINSESSPVEVNLWQATNPETRDFRNYSLDPGWESPVWTSSILNGDGEGNYHAQVPLPDVGWTAFMVEFVFDIGFEYPFAVTTEVSIIPDDLPYATDVTINVVNTLEMFSGFKINGSLTAWNMTELFDDGTHSDITPTDGIWTIRMPAIPDGEFQWIVYGINNVGDDILITEDTNLTLSVNGDEVSGTTLFEVTQLADLNQDGMVDILDIVLTVNLVLANDYNDLADLNNDGIVDILDIVLIVNIILQ